MRAGERLQLWLAGIAAAAAVTGPVAAAIVQVTGGTESASVQCRGVVAGSLRFAQTYPDVATLYADPGHAPALPALASEDEIAACGDPERLLEALADQGLAGGSSGAWDVAGPEEADDRRLPDPGSSPDNGGARSDEGLESGSGDSAERRQDP